MIIVDSCLALRLSQLAACDKPKVSCAKRSEKTKSHKPKVGCAKRLTQIFVFCKHNVYR